MVARVPMQFVGDRRNRMDCSNRPLIGAGAGYFPGTPSGKLTMPGQEQASKAIASDEDASFQLLDEWLRIENEHTNPEFILPDREAIVAWSEKHAVAVLLVAALAVWGPTLTALWFQ
jgi:hypothetical protein